MVIMSLSKAFVEHASTIKLRRLLTLTTKKKLNINFAVVFIKDQKAKLKAKIDKLPPGRLAKIIADWDQNFVKKKPAGRPPKRIFEVLPSASPPPDPPVVYVEVVE
uniref:VHS domain-containing protein n=1 Tax=Rhabditophanes sp. KR3021 TaxID=114890 RepID=A0AC35TU70_9BILA